MRDTSPAACAACTWQRSLRNCTVPGQALGQHGVACSALLQFQHIENLVPRSQQPAQRIGQRERHALALSVIELVARGIGGLLQMLQRPQPHLHRRRQRARAGAGMCRGNPPHLGRPCAELRQKDLADVIVTVKLPALHRFGSLVGRFELRVHPLAGQESRAVLGDSVSAHQAHGLAHHVGAVAGVPQLGRRAQHIGLGILQDELHQRIGRESRARPDRPSASSAARSRAASLSRRAFISARPPCDAALLQGSRSSASRSDQARRTAAPRQIPAKPPPRRRPTHPPAGAVHLRAAGCLARSAPCRAWRPRLRGTGRADSGSPARPPTAASPPSSGRPSRASGGKPLQSPRRD